MPSGGTAVARWWTTSPPRPAMPSCAAPGHAGALKGCIDPARCWDLVLARGIAANGRSMGPWHRTVGRACDVAPVRPRPVQAARWAGVLPAMIIARMSSVETSSTLTMPTSRPFFITAARSQSAFT